MSTTPTTTVLTFAEAARIVPALGGHHVHPSTLWRWCRIGVKARNGRRVKLRHGRLGRRVVIPREALDEFARELALQDGEYFDSRVQDCSDERLAQPRPQTDAQRQAAIDQAERKLATTGFD